MRQSLDKHGVMVRRAALTREGREGLIPTYNGRHARLAADFPVVQLGGRRFSWGREGLVEAAETRRAYVRALQAADAHDIAPLLAFARA